MEALVFQTKLEWYSLMSKCIQIYTANEILRRCMANKIWTKLLPILYVR